MNTTDYSIWFATHTHEFDKDGYCDLCGFHKNELFTNSGIYPEPDIGDDNEYII